MKEKQKEYVKILETYPKAFQNLAYEGMRIIAFAPSETKVFYQARANITLPLVINPPLIGSNQTPEERTLVKDNLYVYDRKEDKNFRVQFDPSALSSFIDEERQSELSAFIRSQTQLEEEARLALGNRSASPAGITAANAAKLEYMIFNNNSPIQWHPNSRNVVINEELLSPDTQSKNKQFAVVDYDGTNKQTVYSGPFENNFYVVTSEGKIIVLANLNPQANPLPDLYTVGIR